jgi:hypothetical protein
MFNRKIISSLGLIVSMAAIFTGCGKTTASVETVTEAETKAVVKEEVTTQAPTEAPTEAETEAVTEAETEAVTEAETEAASVEAYDVEPAQETAQEVVIEVTEAATEAPTEALQTNNQSEIKVETIYDVAAGKTITHTYEVVQFTDEKVDEILRANNSKLVGTPYTYKISETGGCKIYDKDGVKRANILDDGTYYEVNADPIILN